MESLSWIYMIKRNQYSDWDKCVGCGCKPLSECKNCGNVICLKDSCGVTFPHKNKEIFSICKNCENIIDKNFKLVQ